MNHSDDYLQLTLTELGEPECIFRIGTSRFIAKVLLGSGLILSGVLLIYLRWWLKAGGIGHLDFLLAMLPLLGISLLWHIYRQRGLLVLLYPSGLVRLQRGQVQTFCWSEIAYLVLHLVSAKPVILEYSEQGELVNCVIPPVVPALSLWKSSLTLVRTDGVEARFTPALSHYDQLVQEIQRRTFPTLWNLARVSLISMDATLPFGSWQASRLGLYIGKHRLRWSELDEPRIADGKLLVRKRRRWAAWHRTDLSTFPNPHIFWALVHELRRSTSHIDNDSTAGKGANPTQKPLAGD